MIFVQIHLPNSTDLEKPKRINYILESIWSLVSKIFLQANHYALLYQ